ncbi:MAG: T9SS type A sorting domain-containing protein [Bacteroidetes bacterium]|nr:T9SS type A sorting domain-containing protein [Bacteroidota bacterium]
MKRILLFSIAVMFGVSLMAQLKPAKISKSIQSKMAYSHVVKDAPNTFNQPGNVSVHSKSTLDEIIGASRYDMQSNSAMMSRLYLWPDGTLAGTWTRGMADPSYGDRGSGYNYSNGSAWGPEPTTRIETSRTGWPNINPWKGGGECVVAHNATASLVLNTRPAKGTGSWTQTLPFTCPAGIADLVWPRSITNGNNFQNLHVITVGEGDLHGQTAPLLYYRSLDGGATWDKMGIVLPGLDSTQYLAFGGDTYAWIEPHGDTIAFVAGGSWVDTFLMYSYDNGNTWTKKIIVPNYYGTSPSGVLTPSFIGSDGCVAGAMDKNGVFHVAFGRMRWADTGSHNSYYPGTDGLIYWNSTLPAIDTAILTDIDSCIAHKICIGYVSENAAGDSILDPFPLYGNCLTSYPQVTIDQYNNVYCLWSGLTVGNPSADNLNYCHIWGRAKFHDKPDWTEMVDLNAGVLYLFQEYAYPVVAKRLKGDNLLMISQTSPQPGSNIKDATIPIHDVSIEYREVPVSTFWPVGMENNAVTRKNSVGQNYPNPVNGSTYFNVNLDKASNVIVEVSNITGQKVISMNKGIVNAGTQVISIDCSSLTSGVYFYSVKINGESYTHKMIVQ